MVTIVQEFETKWLPDSDRPCSINTQLWDDLYMYKSYSQYISIQAIRQQEVKQMSHRENIHGISYSSISRRAGFVNAGVKLRLKPA